MADVRDVAHHSSIFLVSSTMLRGIGAIRGQPPALGALDMAREMERVATERIALTPVVATACILMRSIAKLMRPPSARPAGLMTPDLATLNC